MPSFRSLGLLKGNKHPTALIGNTAEDSPQSVNGLKAIVSIENVKKINQNIPGRESSPRSWSLQLAQTQLGKAQEIFHGLFSTQATEPNALLEQIPS